MTQVSLYEQHLQQLLQRTETLLAQHQFDSVLIFSGQVKYAFLDDNDYPFRCNPHFKHWLPLTSHPNSFIHLKSGEKPTLYLHQVEDYWHSQPVLPAGEWQAHFSLVIIKDINDVKNALSNQLTNAAIIAEEQAEFIDWGAKAVNPQAYLDHSHYLRAYKSAYEVEQLAIANNLAAEAHVAAEQAFYAGHSELEVHLEYLKTLRHKEVELGYNNIVAFNENNAILHYNDYQRVPPSERRSFLIDAGACVNGYQADITRTYAAQAGEFQSLVVALDLAQQALIRDIKPGETFISLHHKMHIAIAKILVQFNIMKGSIESIVEQGYSNVFFPHGLGHYIGLQVHDVGGYLKNPQGETYNRNPMYPYLRLIRTVETSQVFTIEPGIYFIDQLLKTQKDNPQFNWEVIAQFKPFGGARIEDSVLVHQQGVRNLSREAFERFQTE